MSKEEEPPSWSPRGKEAAILEGSLPEVISPYLLDLINNTGGITGPIGLQFIAQIESERANLNETNKDPLSEDENEVAPGLVYKYKSYTDEEGNFHPGRALWTVTRNCASYCRFCTRGREVGLPKDKSTLSGGALSRVPFLGTPEIQESLQFLANNPEINEVIISGGDPLTLKPENLELIVNSLSTLQKKGQLDIVRIGTRLPIHNPHAVKDWHYELISRLENPRLMVHINHSFELTPQSIAVLQNFKRGANATIMTQSVLLKGVNDNVAALTSLFRQIAKEGFTPYYLYQNDPLPWAEHFTVPIEDAIKLWQKVRPLLSGVAATARFVIDTPHGHGKIPVPEGNAWNIDYEEGYFDFHGVKHSI